jgi:dihydroorotate dehydrogenase (NAD+) catalytic subunit
MYRSMLHTGKGEGVAHGAGRGAGDDKGAEGGAGTGDGAGPDLAVRVGSIALQNPVMTASGTAGCSAELSAYMDMSRLGAVVVKSLGHEPWPGNPPPRLRPVAGGMLNSVGLQGPGVEMWLRDQLPRLMATGAIVVASIWGKTIDDYAKAAAMLQDAPDRVIAVEVNVSCPNLEDAEQMFSCSAEATAAAVRASDAARRPRWVKLSPAAPDLCRVAAAAVEAGAEAVTLVNTLPSSQVRGARYAAGLGGAGGGLSGMPVHQIAQRAIRECRAALGDVAIVGVGGVFNAGGALELLTAGANAVQVGTATFLDPRAPVRVLCELEDLCVRRGARSLEELLGR